MISHTHINVSFSCLYLWEIICSCSFQATRVCVTEKASTAIPLGRVVWHLSTQSRPLKQQGVFVWICRTAHTLLQSSEAFRRSSSINRAGLWFPVQNLHSNSLPEIHNNPTSLRNNLDLRLYIEMIFGWRT